MNSISDLSNLQLRIEQLEQENAMLRRDFHNLPQGSSVIVPEEMKPLFDIAQQTVGEYFRDLKMDPAKGTIEIHDQRYVLVRASTLSKDFLDTVQKLYADRGAAEAFAIGKNFLFDISHVIGMNDARNFHAKMNLTDPIAKLSAGPVHFAYSGWAFVDILPESNPTPDDDYFLIYNHPYSFEADSWKRAGKIADVPVCIMNTGYSSGWCEESFGIPLTAVEVTCTAKGDEHCTFIMSPPHRIQEHLERFNKQSKKDYSKQEQYEIPTFFERKKVEEEMQRSKLMAEESAKAKSDFVANMSHELRTPLSAILGFADLIKKTPLNNEQQEYLEAINSSGQNLLAVINDILDLSKLDAGKFSIEQINFRIPELIHSLQLMFTGKAKDKNLTFSCQADVALQQPVSGDPKKLTQILINLIGNAIKFTDEGSITVSCKLIDHDQDHSIVEFRVKDTGIGIPEDKQESIFERFTQADTDTTRKYGGSGLGLSIARQLVVLLGGTLSLHSEPNKGTEFSFSLPFLSASKESTEKNVNKNATVPIQATRTILVVEDSIMNQKLARIILHNNGFEVTIAENGQEAIDLLKEKTFDLILMDIQMPVMDGCLATCIIRNELKLTTPIIAMTAHALDGEKEKCIREGMNDYLAKPFKEEELLQKIAAWPPKGKTEPLTKSNLIDLSFLKQQTRDNDSFISEMVGLFKKEIPTNIEQLRAAIENKNFDVTYKTTHLIRNMVGFFGLQSLIGAELLKMESSARAQENIDEIATLFIKIETTCTQALSELKQMDL
jgi:signal transduction histidine kinase/CheY-like chemotaxis protein/HPt (histidine-containing phosphotransfer) domain-containing protein